MEIIKWTVRIILLLLLLVFFRYIAILPSILTFFIGVFLGSFFMIWILYRKTGTARAFIDAITDKLTGDK